jgi:hypothetical protein
LAAKGLIDPASIPTDVKSGYLPGRSGQVIVKPLNTQETTAAVVFIDESSQYIKPKSLEETLPAVHIADVITRTLGLEPLNTAYTPRFVKSNFLRNARANALFSIEGLGEGCIEHHDLTNLERLVHEGSLMPLTYPVYPQQSLSLSASIATGKLPSQHGIVSNAWQRADGRTNAFVSEGENAAPLTANIADVLQQTFKGVPLVISTSSDPQQAFAYCPNYSLMKKNPSWNYLCLSQDPETETFSTMGPENRKHDLDSSLVCTREELLANLAGSPSVFAGLADGVDASVTGSKVTVNYRQEGEVISATYDLSAPEDRALFAELQYAHTLAERLESAHELNALVKDDVPDFYAVSFASLPALVEKYGHGSPQTIGGAKLIDAALPQLVKSFQSLYPQRLVAEVVLLGTDQGADQSALEEVARAFPKMAADYYPNYYLENGRKNKVCQDMASKLNPKDIAVYCPNPDVYTFSLLAVGDSSTNYTSPSDAEIQVFQIAMWFSIGIAMITLWAVYVLGWMSFKKDTFLYSTFNPNWEDRKRR